MTAATCLSRREANIASTGDPTEVYTSGPGGCPPRYPRGGVSDGGELGQPKKMGHHVDYTKRVYSGLVVKGRRIGAMSDLRYLMAVDPSLTCSGWALLSIREGEVLAVGKIKSAPPSVPLATRLERLQSSITKVLNNLALGAVDVLVCESPTTMKDPHNAIKVEQVRGLFESTGRSRGVVVPGRVNPRSVQFEVMGLTGKQVARTAVKAAAVRTVQYLYGPTLRRLGLAATEEELKRHQDIVDAMLIGRFAVLRIQGALEAQQPLESIFDTQSKQQRSSWRVRSCAV